VPIRRFVTLFLTLVALAALAAAGPFTSVIVYGDSLSDNGNLYAATGGIPGAPYWQGRRSNGPVAVEDLAANLGAPLHDFAWIGATTGLGNYADGGTPTSSGLHGFPGMAAEYAGSAGSIAPLAPSSLFVIWGGPNDFLSPSPLDGGDPLKTADRAVADLLALVAEAQGLGAQHILVPGMPDLGLTPYFQSIGEGALGSSLTDYFNGKLKSGLPSGVTYFDTAGLMRNIVANPGAYGFADVTDACFNSAVPSLCANPDSYLFFDSFHPTAHADEILANGFTSAVVPEPATYVLFVSAFACAAVARRIRR
jgi:phospholipase/lecithinase/hemolysin